MRIIPLLFIAASLVLYGCSDGPKGTVKIVTSPGDAEIYIDGERKGNSPSEIGQTFAIKLTEGEYRISAIKPSKGIKEDYAEKNIVVSPDTLQTVSLNLEEERTSAAFIQKAKKTDPRPVMVSIPAGRFQMGCVSGKKCRGDEKPVHAVTMAAFKMSKYEITFAQWDACVAHGGCQHLPDDAGWGRANRPVINVSYNDITQEFIPWLNKTTGQRYRLPSEAEWEYAARAGTTTLYSWGNEIDCAKARFDGGKNSICSDKKANGDVRGTAEVGQYPPNAFGLYDMHGNVWEWTQDCLNDSYSGAPTNGSAWLSGECGYRLLRGGSWSNDAGNLRSATRNDNAPSYRHYLYGFRVVQGF